MVKKYVDDETEINLENDRTIHGSFVLGCKVTQNRIGKSYLIKLSSINTIHPVDGEEDSRCIFYTYKDCCYITDIGINELRRAIDSFIFNPETHWESYGY